MTLGNSGPVAVGWVCPGRAGEFLSTDRNRPQPAWVSLWISRGCSVSGCRTNQNLCCLNNERKQSSGSKYFFQAVGIEHSVAPDFQLRRIGGSYPSNDVCRQRTETANQLTL